MVTFVDPDGPESTDTDGGVVSTENDCSLSAWFPTASVARTRNTYGPSANGPPTTSVDVLVHGPYAGVPWSTEHATLVAVASTTVNANDGVVSLLSGGGPESTDRDGGVVSTVNDCVASVCSCWSSVARTRKT